MLNIIKTIHFPLFCLLTALSSCEFEPLDDVDPSNPLTETVTTTETDIIPDKTTNDDDGDLYSNAIELQLGSDPNDPLDFPSDVDSDHIPDQLDAYPNDPARFEQKVTISIGGIDHSVQVLINGQTITYENNEELNVYVNNLNFDINITSSDFNELSRCELIDQTDEFNFTYRCGTWITPDIVDKGYYEGGTEFENMTMCVFEHSNEDYNTDGGFYAEEIEYLNCFGNINMNYLSYYKNIKILELATNFITFDDTGNPNNFNIYGFNQLEEIILWGNDLPAINISDCMELKEIRTRNTYIESLDISNCHNFESIYSRGGKVGEVNFGDLGQVKNIAVNIKKSSNKIDISKMLKLETYQSNLAFINHSILSNLKSVDIEGDSDIDIDGDIYIDINLSLITNVEYLELKNIELKEIDLTGFESILSLNLNGNQLSEIDISGLNKLSDLTLSSNNLSSIDISNNLDLDNLNLSSNDISTIDLINHSKISSLILSNNKITSIDLNNNVELELLNLYGNKIESLDLTSNINIEDIWVGNNIISELLFPKNINIQSARLNNNNLSYLDMEDVSVWGEFNLRSNEFETLDLRGAKKIGDLDVGENNLTSILALEGLIARTLKTESKTFKAVRLDNLSTFDEQYLIENYDF